MRDIGGEERLSITLMVRRRAEDFMILILFVRVILIVRTTDTHKRIKVDEIRTFTENRKWLFS